MQGKPKDCFRGVSLSMPKNCFRGVSLGTLIQFVLFIPIKDSILIASFLVSISV